MSLRDELPHSVEPFRPTEHRDVRFELSHFELYLLRLAFAHIRRIRDDEVEIRTLEASKQIVLLEAHPIQLQSRSIGARDLECIG